MVMAIGGFVLLMLIEFVYGKYKKKQLYRLSDTEYYGQAWGARGRQSGALLHADRHC